MISNNNNLQIDMIMNAQSHTRIVMWQFIQNIHKYEFFLENNHFIQHYKWFTFFPFNYPFFQTFMTKTVLEKKTISPSPLLFPHFPYLQQNDLFWKHVHKYPIFLHTFQNLKMAFWFVPNTFISIHVCLK